MVLKQFDIYLCYPKQRKANPDKLADGSQKKNGRMDSVAFDPSIEKVLFYVFFSQV